MQRPSDYLMQFNQWLDDLGGPTRALIQYYEDRFDAAGITCYAVALLPSSILDATTWSIEFGVGRPLADLENIVLGQKEHNWQYEK